MQIKITGIKNVTHLKIDNFASENVENFNTVGPRFTNAPVHEQFGSRTNFPSKKRIG
jgi:hypothetical protein